MVGFPTEEEGDFNQASKIKESKEPFNNLDLDSIVIDPSFSDSFLDLDSIQEWFEDRPYLESLEDTEFGAMEIVKEEPVDKEFAGSEVVGGGLGSQVKVEVEAEGGLGCCIEEEMGKVSLDVDRVEDKEATVDAEDGSSSSSSEESESESSSSSSSSSEDDDDDEEEEVKPKVEREVDEAGELEEGEIRAVNDEGDDAEFEFLDEDDDDCNAPKGPIKSKNEVENLPPVPPVTVTLQPNHQMLPVGVVLSIVDAKVIVEGSEKHNPLHEGSILWISDKRLPLGIVDEVFGPVKNPYYVVRYNSETEVPAGIQEGNLIAFVPEFAQHVLNDQNVYKKGYDASGEHDEEISDDGEFSDDEEEAEYKRRINMEKRGMSDQRQGNKKGNKKKMKNRNEAWKNSRDNATTQEQSMHSQQLPNQNGHRFSPAAGSRGNPNGPSSSTTGQSFVGGTGFAPPFPVMSQSPNLAAPSNGVWSNGMQGQQPQGNMFPNGFPAGLPWLPQNQLQQQFPMPFPMGGSMAMPPSMQYQQQQFNPYQNSLPNMVLPGGQSGLFGGPSFAPGPWMGNLGQGGYNPAMLGMNMQNQLPLNASETSITPGGPEPERNNNLQQSNPVTGNMGTPQQFNMGASSFRGRGRHHRGGGRFGGGRGRQQPN